MLGHPNLTTQFQTIFRDDTMTITPHDTLAAANNLYKLRHFISRSQKLAIREALKGEEKQFFIDKLVEFIGRIETMPKTYEQNGKGREAVAFLHYFMGNMDWYIMEKDLDEDGKGQIQAFGQADLGYGAEIGYISIVELIENEVELDLHFDPTPISQINVT